MQLSHRSARIYHLAASLQRICEKDLERECKKNCQIVQDPRKEGILACEATAGANIAPHQNMQP